MLFVRLPVPAHVTVSGYAALAGVAVEGESFAAELHLIFVVKVERVAQSLPPGIQVASPGHDARLELEGGAAIHVGPGNPSGGQNPTHGD